jgi:aminoglycoside phosphotransferase (APT) family kinase protein
MDAVEVVVAHTERATLRVGDVFLKIDGDRSRLDHEINVMGMAPVPTPQVLWRQPPVLALAALDGSPLGHLGEPSPSPAEAWRATGAAIRRLHDAPLPPWHGPSVEDRTARLEAECDWLLAHDVLPAEVVTHNRNLARRALRPWSPTFVHGDLQVDHVFVDVDRVTGVLDWSEGAQGDAMYDLATLTIGHPEHLDDVVTGYGTDVDRDVIRGWWSYRGLTSARWLIEHGFDPDSPGCEFAVLRAQL